MSRIYTRTGDTGETGLFGGGRVPKSHPRVAAYGTVDELSATLGWVATLLDDPELRTRITLVQGDLFTLGAHLATPVGARSEAHLPELPAGRPSEFERWIDAAEEDLQPLTSFIVPGGSQAGASLHLARTVCRRAERAVVALADEDEVRPLVTVYLNRLSDLLFVWARWVNQQAGQEETPWQGG